MEVDIIIFCGCFIMEKFRVQVWAISAINLSGEVQWKHTTEKNTCMTSSEDNLVSIPPKRSGIGLSDDRSCVSSQKLVFDYMVFCRFSAGNRHWYIKTRYPLFEFCSRLQVLRVSCSRAHVKSWNIIIWSCLAGPLSGGLQGFKD